MFLIEKSILWSVVLLSFISICLIPKEKYRQASFIFLFAQFPAWIFGLIVVEVGWIEYPVRLLVKANRTSIIFEYLVLPIICIFFNIYYPSGQGFYKKIKYFLAILGVFTLLEYFTEKYTALIHYVHWEWYLTFVTMAIFFYFVRSVYKWFFKLERTLKNSNKQTYN